MEEKKTSRAHNLILEGRKSLIISGVSDVDSFDDQTIIAYTDMGELTIKGENLHITRLSIETGELNVDGKVFSLSYADNLPKSTGFLTKLFR